MHDNTPDCVRIEGIGRWSIGLKYGQYGGEIVPYVSVKDESIKVGELYYNSWDDEMMEITDISDPCDHCGKQTVTANVINKNDTFTKEKEWFTVDHERIHHMREASELLTWQD